MKIGFIGQGWIGKNYADNYEERGYEVVRYSLEEKFIHNKDKVGLCDIVIIAVPTPTTTSGFDYSIVEEGIKLCSDQSLIVVKSTMLPGTTLKLQEKFPGKTVFCSPEFLSERTAALDVQRPHAHVVGVPYKTKENLDKADMLLKTFPFAPFTEVCTSTEAELIKYSRNVHGVFEILFYNMLYDLAGKLGADYENIKEYIKNDPLHVYRYASPVHASGHDLQNPKRGAGGHCFIKDFKAFKDFLSYNLKDEKYVNMLSAIEAKNIELLRNSEKDLDLLEGVYGKSNENKN
jgi:UDP-glucose 6-dehydrogenase